MTADQVQFIFEGMAGLVVTAYLIGLGMGYIIKLIRSAVDKN
jgi:hypothetical protein